MNKNKRIGQYLFLVIFLQSFLLSTQLSDYVDTKKCDQIIDKQLYQICYSYKYKGALSGWVRLDGSLVNSFNDIKQREKFYNESTIPMQYRSKNSDYNRYEKDWSRGHFVVADVDEYEYLHKLNLCQFGEAFYFYYRLNSKNWLLKI
jgi:endonuclease G